MTPPEQTPTKPPSAQSFMTLGCGVVLLCLCTCFGFASRSVVQKQRELVPIADAFAKKLEQGDREGAYESAHPRLRAAVSLEDFEATLAALEGRLGKLRGRSFTGLSVSAGVDASKGQRAIATLSYSATWDKGSGTISVQLEQDEAAEGTWKVLSWKAKSPLLEGLAPVNSSD